MPTTELEGKKFYVVTASDNQKIYVSYAKSLPHGPKKDLFFGVIKRRNPTDLMIPPDEHATLQTVMDNLCSQLNTKYGIKPAQLHERGDVMDKHYYLACNNRSPDIIDVIMRLLEKENKRLNNVVEKPYQSLNDPTETGTEHQNRLNQTNNPEISR